MIVIVNQMHHVQAMYIYIYMINWGKHTKRCGTSTSYRLSSQETIGTMGCPNLCQFTAPLLPEIPVITTYNLIYRMYDHNPIYK